MTADRGAADATRARALALAREWIGTPFRHGASRRGAGTDCLGLVRGVWRDLYGCEPAPVPVYAPDWGESGDAAAAALVAALARRFRPLAPTEARPGDVVLLRWRRLGPAKHLGVLGSGSEGRLTLVHAYSGRGVVETPLGAAWPTAIAAAFGFPELE